MGKLSSSVYEELQKTYLGGYLSDKPPDHTVTGPRRPGRPSGYRESNPYYAQQAFYNRNFNQGNVFDKGKGSGNLSYAAARSGVVNNAGYGAIQTRQEATSSKSAHSMRHGSIPFQFSRKHGYGTPIINNLRLRTAGNMWRSTGWVGQLSLSSGPNKAFGTGAGGRGQSSEDSTKEMYSTDETRMGTRAWFTDEVWNEAKGKFGQMWTGFKDLGETGGTPFLHAQLGQMYVRNNPNVGFARRVKRGL